MPQYSSSLSARRLTNLAATASTLVCLAATVFGFASRVSAAPLIDATAGDRSSTSLADLTAADDRFLTWDAPASAVSAKDLPGADEPAVVASSDALAGAFDGENPIIPLPPSLVVGIVGLAVVGGIAIRRQQAAAGPAKFF